MFGINYSSLSLVLYVNLPHPQPFLFLYGYRLLPLVGFFLSVFKKLLGFPRPKQSQRACNSGFVVSSFEAASVKD